MSNKTEIWIWNHETGKMEHAGPEYPKLNGPITKYRFAARDGLQSLSLNERRAYGAAVGSAILSLQRSELIRALQPDKRPNCASGTAHNTGEAIHQAILDQQHNAMIAYPGKIRRARTGTQWREMYEAAMKQNRKASGVQKHDLEFRSDIHIEIPF